MCIKDRKSFFTGGQNADFRFCGRRKQRLAFFLRKLRRKDSGKTGWNRKWKISILYKTIFIIHSYFVPENRDFSLQYEKKWVILSRNEKTEEETCRTRKI